MFIGREREMAKIAKRLKLGRSLTLLYGKRRVGKTRLLREALGPIPPVSLAEICLGDLEPETVAERIRSWGVEIFSSWRRMHPVRRSKTKSTRARLHEPRMTVSSFARFASSRLGVRSAFTLRPIHG